MTSINLTLELPESLAERARAAGLLNSERIAALLEMELKRQSAWQYINQAAALVNEAAVEDFGHL
jgi:post-segregation antitoxin (ccd killing protein)